MKKKSAKRIYNLSCEIVQRWDDYSKVRCTYSFNGEKKIFMSYMSNGLLGDLRIDKSKLFRQIVFDYENDQNG